MNGWLDWYWEKLWQCRIKDKHLAKMDSNGRCYRCNKKLMGFGGSPTEYVRRKQ